MTDSELAAHVADGGRLRALVLELWQRTRMDWGFVTDRLAIAFRKERWLGAHERRFVGEVLYGLVRHLRRVDLAIERGRKTKQAPRDLERLLALLVLEKWLPPARAARSVPELDWTAVAGADDAIARVRDRTERIALACSLPDWLATRMVADWGHDAEPLARALNARAPMTVRANLLVVASRDELALPLATHPGRWCDTAVIVDERANLFSLEAFQRGAFEAQDEGSQLLADLVVAAAPPRPLVIDYCAGAGGKTLAIAARLGNRGRIVATDVDDGKLAELRRRARRAGVTNAQAMLVDDLALDAVRQASRAAPSDDAGAPRGKADVVFVDAPCTGTGALRRNPEARWRLREADVATFAARQKEILGRARQLCAPTGRVVYATCSILRAENEDVIAGQPIVPGLVRAELARGDCFTVTPHQHGTDGFFAAVLGHR